MAKLIIKPTVTLTIPAKKKYGKPVNFISVKQIKKC